MIKLDLLESKNDLDEYLHSKKRVSELIDKIDGSMLNFHKEVKTVKEMENIALNFFRDKKRIKEIRSNNGGISESALNLRVDKIVSVQTEDIDFI